MVDDALEGQRIENGKPPVARAVSRRRFAGLGGLAGVAMAAPALVGRAWADGVNGSEREERHQVVIIGAGVGGCVAAFRLAQAGIGNVVLERGRRWPITPSGGTFPRMLAPDARSFWLDGRPSLPPASDVPVVSQALDAFNSLVLPRFAGLLDFTVDENVIVVCGAGVGGGTLVYGGVLPQPAPGPFHRVFPSVLDYGELDRTYYPRARRRLAAATFPDDVLRHPRYRSTRLWRSAVERTGLPVERVPGGFDYDVVRAELAGRARASATVGEWVGTGCDSGAKLSVDRTYLARAEATGKTLVRPLHRVTSLTQDRDGAYRVVAEQLTETGRVVRRAVLVCDKVVVAAGGVHTPRLLVTARDTGALPRLNGSVGTGWGTNGDRLVLLKTLLTPTGAPQGGPVAFMVNDRGDADRATLMHGGLPFPVETGLLGCFGMGIPSRTGAWAYDHATGHARLDWPRDADTGPQRAVMALAHQVARRLPLGTAAIDASAPYPLTVHPLGGAVIGKATDAYGRLHGYDGLYCLDASLMPGSTAAVNPALTIAAVVERCLDDILKRDFARPPRSRPNVPRRGLTPWDGGRPARQ